MKKIAFGVIAVLLITSLLSCVSMTSRPMTATERAQNPQIVGRVSTEFTRYQFLHIRNSQRLERRVHDELLSQARMRYPGNIAIRNIVITGHRTTGQRLLTYVPMVPFLVTGVGTLINLEENRSFGIWVNTWYASALVSSLGTLGNFQRITATGDVVLLEGGAHQGGLQGAVSSAAATMMRAMPADTTIAIIGVEAQDIASANFVVDTLEFALFQSGNFRLVSRAQLTAILQEQGLHVSGHVDDNSAVSIGNMLGAGLVITGSIGGVGANQRLALRALDVQTAMIVAMALEDF